MWAKFRTSTSDELQKYPVLHKCFNVNEEYIHATRTQSYVDFFAKAQSLFTEPSSPLNSCHHTTEVLLEPDQCLVPAALDSLLLGFFDVSAEASRICSSLLRSINETQANYKFIERALDRFSHCTPEQYDSAIVELDSFALLSNPFDDDEDDDGPWPERFDRIKDRCGALLRGLSSRRRRKVKRRTKLANVVEYYFKRSRMRRDLERVEVAAKGTYILSRDVDTTSRAVVRLRGEVEHMKETIRYCMERRGDRFPLQEVVKDLKKRGRGFRRHVEELEEHVCLCLVTINRARVLVMKEVDG